MNRDNYWARWSDRRLTRRATLATFGVAGAGGAALALVGCGDDDSTKATPGATTATGQTPGTTATAAPPKDLSKLSLSDFRTLFSGARLKDLPGQKNGPTSGGTIRYSSRTPITWDPLSPGGSVLSSYQFAHNQLIQFKIQDWVKTPNLMEVEAVLAEKMPEQPDDLTFIFHIRKGVKFQNVAPVNGRELTADDIVYTTELYKKAPVQGPTFQDVQSVTKIDDYTVQFKMAKPAAYFLGSMVVPFHWIFAREQHQSADGLVKIPIGTGGFLFESSENLQGFKFKKNPAYFRKDERTGKQLPYLDRIEATYYPSPAQSIAAFRANEFDHVWPQNFEAWLDVMKSNPDSVTQVTTPPPSFQPYIAMRLDKDPFKDPRVRRALSLLIDRDTIIASLAQGMAGYGYGQDWTYFGSEYPFEPSKLGPWFKYDPKQAKQLLDAAGVKDLQLDFLMGQFAGFNFDVWTAIAGMWQKDAGIKTTIDAPQDSATWQSKFFGGTYNHLMGIGYVGPGWDPDTFAYQALHSKSTKNYFKVNDPKVDELALKQRETMNTDARKKILAELMDYDLDQVTRLWTVAPYKINLRKPNFYNLTDTEAAWNPVGWGSSGFDLAWKSS
jgi:ABC-type transport system substrate-binding protein